MKTRWILLTACALSASLLAPARGFSDHGSGNPPAVPQGVPAAALDGSKGLDGTLAVFYQRIFSLTGEIRELRLNRDVEAQNQERLVAGEILAMRDALAREGQSHDQYSDGDLRRWSLVEIRHPGSTWRNAYSKYVWDKRLDAGLEAFYRNYDEKVSVGWLIKQMDAIGEAVNALDLIGVRRARTDAKIAALEKELEGVRAMLRELLEAVKAK